MFKRDMFLLLNINQVAKGSEDFNDGVPIPAMEWNFGDLNPVIITSRDRM